MEKQEKRVSRVERNRKKYKSIKRASNNVERLGNYDDVNNICEIRVRRSDRYKKKRRNVFFCGKIKNKDAEIITQKTKRIKFGIYTLSLCSILSIVAGTTLYFNSHFYLGTSINNINVSGKSIDEVENIFKKNLIDYNLKLIGRDNAEENITASDIDLIYDESKKYEIHELKSMQNKSWWFNSFLLKKENGNINEYAYTSSIVNYNPEKLNEIIEKLEVINNKNIVEPKNPSFKYDGDSFVIENEVQGNKINKDKLLEEVSNVISKGQNELDLDKSECYEKPKYSSSSKEVLNAENKLNQYKDFKIIYDIGGFDEEILGDNLLEFFEFDENYNYTLNEDKISEYVDKLCSKYNTYGTSHKFITTDGNIITVTGGDYGYAIDKEREIQQIKEDIEGKKYVSREPIYSKRGLGEISNDIGRTYVEINMNKQHLWFYKDGALITEGDIVTGCVANGTDTPEGIYSLKYKAKDSVLVGEGYRSPVSFWMPFNNNIGIHDASWRSVFGGKIYLSSGSHGCVNVPYGVAESIYSNIDSGIPVVCYN